MLAMPQVWWLRPVSSAARVGEHSAVVLNWLYLSPLLATRSKLGVGIGPPNVLVETKPVSSDLINRTLGAPLGAVTPPGKSGLDSLALRPMTPPNGSSRTGRIGEPPDAEFCADFCAGLVCPSCAMAAPPITTTNARNVTAMRHIIV